MRAPLSVLLVLLALLLSPLALAEPAAPPAQPAAPPGQPVAPDAAAQDPLGRSTPRGTVLGFMKAAQMTDYAHAAMYLDVRPGAGQAQDLAKQLKVILDRGLAVNLDLLSTRPEGEMADSTNPNRDLVGVATSGGKSLEIHLDRVQRGKNPPMWLFASDTLRKVPEMYEEIGPPWIEAYLPRPLLDTRFLTFSLWQWIGMILVIPIALLLARAINRLLIPALRPAVRYVTREQDDRQLSRIEWPVRLLTLVVTSYWSVSLLALPFLARQFWGRIAMTLGIVATTWLVIRLNHIVAELAGRHLERTARTASLSIVRLVQRLVTAAAILAGGLVFLYMLGFDLTAALAGLGVGGIAIALAAQKTLENLFGGIMLTSDQPVRVGDFCRFGDQVGTVEDIGLRSTRIRTLDRTLVSVPNGHLSSISLENFGLRDKIWFHPTIQLRYETTADQLRYVLAEIRHLLYAHPKVESQSARVRFVRFGNSSLDLDIFAYVYATDYAVFLEIQEDLLLRIVDIIEQSGTSFAFPSHTAYVTRDRGLDPEKTQAAVAQVQQWRAQKELPFPNFAPERIVKIGDTIEYPPPDSALRDKG
jgi:MscS family membrane protein